MPYPRPTRQRQGTWIGSAIFICIVGLPILFAEVALRLARWAGRSSHE